ncbi:hypothetical protein J6S37_01010 [Candidatus Saccharibacteria bacterium]|nr:hypothetical protein [Candidatus Saccharibacteria bacterium]
MKKVYLRKINVEKTAQIIVEKGGEYTARKQGDHIHHSACLEEEKWHLSWDEYPDGTVKNVRSDKNGRSYMFLG